MKKSILKLPLLLILMLLSTIAKSHAQPVEFVYEKFRLGDGRGYDEGYTTIGTTIVNFEDFSDSYPFLDLRFHRVYPGRFASNFGLGWRTVLSNPTDVFGANVYYDFRRQVGHDFHQLGFGLELLRSNYDIRANAYIPVGSRNSLVDQELVLYTGGYFALIQEQRASIYGGELEFGRYIFSADGVDLYAAVGPYFYSSQCCCASSSIGGMVRLDLTLGNYLSVRFYASHDELFRTKAQGEVYLEIPLFSPRKLAGWFFEPVYRNEIIVTEKLCCYETNF